MKRVANLLVTESHEDHLIAAVGGEDGHIDGWVYLFHGSDGRYRVRTGFNADRPCCVSRYYTTALRRYHEEVGRIVLEALKEEQ